MYKLIYAVYLYFGSKAVYDKEMNKIKGVHYQCRLSFNAGLY